MSNSLLNTIHASVGSGLAIAPALQSVSGGTLTTQNMVLPKIEGDASSQNYARFVISPLENGYGITIGNALRRVLLSSLPAAALTSIRVSVVPPEFSAIPSVKEDMPQLIFPFKH